MRIVARYSFNNGEEEVSERYPHPLKEVEEVIEAIDASEHKSKRSNEKNRKLRMLFNPRALNRAFKVEFRRET